MKKKIVILGASGFIGQNCLQYFAQNKKYKDYKIVGTYFKKKPKNIKNVKLIKVDLTDKKMPQSFFKNTNILIQAAACTTGAKDIVSKPFMHVNDNVVMNSFVTKFAHKYKIPRVIIFSCTVMYKSSKKPLREIDFNANDQMYEKFLQGYDIVAPDWVLSPSQFLEGHFSASSCERVVSKNESDAKAAAMKNAREEITRYIQGMNSAGSSGTRVLVSNIYMSESARWFRDGQPAFCVLASINYDALRSAMDTQ